MRILITRSSENQTIGGAELSARDQAFALQDLGHTPLMLTNSVRMRAELKAKEIQAYSSFYLQRFTPPFRYIYFWALFPLKLLIDLLLVWRLDPDIINPHTREDQISFTLTKPFHRKPVIWKDPGDMVFVFTQRHGLIGGMYRRLYSYAARKADHIYMLNDDHIDLLSSALALNPANLSSIPSSILYKQYRPEPIDPHDHIVFGSLCRLTTAKNVNLLIEAFKTVHRLRPHTELRIAGAGPELKHLQSLAHDMSSVKFIGAYADVSPVLNQLDIVVHPALEEGWGRVIKESMYFGKPIIGSRVGGVKRQIKDGETGLLFDPRDKQALIEKMLQLVDDATYRQKLGSNAHKKAIRDKDFVYVVREKILPIYERFV